MSLPRTRRRAGPLDKVPAPLLFIVGAVSLYSGAALAFRLFESVPPPGVAWLRTVGAAIVLLAWRRPWRGQWDLSRFLLVLAFGTTVAVMNLNYYFAIERLPLATTTAIMFAGPIAVAVSGSRSPRQVLALLLAIAGVGLLADIQWQGSPAGVGFALLAALCWAAYILLGSRVAARGHGVDSLAAGTALGCVVIAPFAAPSALPAFGDASLLVVGLGIGLLSNVIPYGIDQVVLHRVSGSTFALLISLLPATAAVLAFVVLGQVLTPAEIVGIALVAVAVAVRGGGP